jgi:hypothetical protein
LDCGCGVNVELRGLPDGLDLGLEGKWSIKGDPKWFGPSNWENRIAIYWGG